MAYFYLLARSQPHLTMHAPNISRETGMNLWRHYEEVYDSYIPKQHEKTER